MSLQYIIDAYNIINHPLFNPPAKKSFCIQLALHDFIKVNKLTGSAQNTVILVFDGYPAAGQETPAERGWLWVFSRKIEADEKIKKLIEESAQPKNIVVVSDDRQVQIASKLLHAQVRGVEEFIRGRQRNKVLSTVRPDAEPDSLTYTKMQKINAELKKIWLGEN